MSEVNTKFPRPLHFPLLKLTARLSAQCKMIRMLNWQTIRKEWFSKVRGDLLSGKRPLLTYPLFMRTALVSLMLLTGAY